MSANKNGFNFGNGGIHEEGKMREREEGKLLMWEFGDLNNG
jgi:hypothetical protein